MNLYFYYNEKEYTLVVDREIKIKDLINNLKRQDKKIPENFSLYFQTENDLIELEKDKAIGDYDIQNGNKLTII